jgi:uncharacterized protein YkwD
VRIFFAATPGLSLWEPDPITAERLHKIARQIQQEVNHARQTVRIPPLIWNEQLAAEAGRHARNMAEKRFFAHEDPARGNLFNRLDKSGIEWRRSAENLYEQVGDKNPSEEAVRTWLHSAGHSRNMMNAMLSEAGVGAALQRDGTLVMVKEYISK